MKKFIAILLVAVMSLTGILFVACQKADVILVLHPNNGEPNRVIHYTSETVLPHFTYGDKTFGGWYFDENFEKPFSTENLEGRVNLYAKWNDNSSATEKVTVTFVYNDGLTDNKTVTIDKGATVNLSNPTRSGYTFDGWYTQVSGGIKWSANTSVSQNLSLYAHWTANGQVEPNPSPVDLSAVFNQYTDISSWNFAVSLTTDDGNELYEYCGDKISYKYTGDDGKTYTDYLELSGTYYYYLDNGDGTYTKYSEESDEFSEAYAYMSIVDLTLIGKYSFVESNGYYAAEKPNEAGNDVLGEYINYTWKTFNVYIANGKITKLVGIMNDDYTMAFEFSKYGQITVTLPEATEGGSSGGGDGDPLPTEPKGVMENQVYNADTFDNSNLQDKLLSVENAIGLPSTGTYNALVIPVQFKGDTITQTQLNNLNVAFNGTSTETGWESVKTFYQKSSYGNLNLTFDIQPVFQASSTASYYSNYKGTFEYSDGTTQEKDGSALILEQALAWCVEQGIDLSKYDINNDGCIDAVYLIYSENVDYDSAAFFWAYVTWYGGETQYGGLDAFYYLFAGFDFMTEGLNQKPGMKINAETYIHETGHLLGLDDYYDYETSQGGNQGLGGADMMDYNVGDHGVYSKIMLGWLDPTIITSTQTVTIKSSQAEGYAILIPLNFDNTYFCEYLLIDLYSAQGVNAMGASQTNTILYGGAEYGVRIYHVTSWAKDPYNNSYGSFTDCNNSNSNIPLIKLIEADGETSSSVSGSWASESDLWQTGDTFSKVFQQYMRNDGKTLNFDISITDVSAQSATITITFAV